MHQQVTFTYEVGIDEPIHPDPEVASRFLEYAMSTCAFGCKIYRDLVSDVQVLAHNSTYGCTKTKSVLFK